MGTKTKQGEQLQHNGDEKDVLFKLYGPKSNIFYKWMTKNIIDPYKL